MYYLACCDDNGICIGFLKKDRRVSENPDRDKENLNLDRDKENLMCFTKKRDAYKIINQINLSHLLMPNGYPFMVAVIKDN